MDYSYLLKLAKGDLGIAADNLHRAKEAARGRDTGALWGENGETLQSIIDDYAKWRDKAQAIVDDLTAKAAE